MKKILLCILIIAALAAVVFFLVNKNSSDTNIQTTEPSTSFDAKNSSFTVEDAPVTLVNGVSEVGLASIPGAKITTRYFGNEIKHDLDNDGREDAVFLVTQDGGGSGTFFYVVAVLNTVHGYLGSNSYPLGDRIAPQSVTIDEGATAQGTMRDNVIVVNYAVRKLNEPMTATPSVGKSVWIKLDPETMQFGEVAQNFEGESR